MKTLILGPTRTLMVGESAEDVIASLSAWIDSDACPFDASHRAGHFQLALPEKQRKAWSAYLTIEVRPAFTAELPVGVLQEGVPLPPEEAAAAEHAGPTEIFGRFNPSPGLWTGYMLTTIALFTVILGAIAWGGSQVMLGKPPHALWIGAASLVMIAAMWTLSGIGQHLARDEMAAMWSGMEEAMGERRRLTAR
ncbi:MAG: hypothetical protein AAGB34_04975 [Planctomycetota bacterium]